MLPPTNAKSLRSRSALSASKPRTFWRPPTHSCRGAYALVAAGLSSGPRTLSVRVVPSSPPGLDFRLLPASSSRPDGRPPAHTTNPLVACSARGEAATRAQHSAAKPQDISSSDRIGDYSLGASPGRRACEPAWVKAKAESEPAAAPSRTDLLIIISRSVQPPCHRLCCPRESKVSSFSVCAFSSKTSHFLALLSLLATCSGFS